MDFAPPVATPVEIKISYSEAAKSRWQDPEYRERVTRAQKHLRSYPSPEEYCKRCTTSKARNQKVGLCNACIEADIRASRR